MHGLPVYSVIRLTVFLSAVSCNWFFFHSIYLHSFSRLVTIPLSKTSTWNRNRQLASIQLLFLFCLQRMYVRKRIIVCNSLTTVYFSFLFVCRIVVYKICETCIVYVITLCKKKFKAKWSYVVFVYLIIGATTTNM